MKKYCLLLIVFIGFCSCSEIGDIDDVIISKERFSEGITALSVDKESLEFEAEGGQQSLTVRSNTSWSVQSTASWYSLSVGAGTGTATITVTANQNTSTEERSGNLIISSGDKSVTVKVRQKAAEGPSGIPGADDNTPPTL